MSKQTRARSADTEEPNFEAALESLEELVARLEQGDLSLEDSLQTFEQGIRLVRLCSGRLKDAELRITQLDQDSPNAEPSELEVDE